MRKVNHTVLDRDEGPREETRSERIAREQREAVETARREVIRLNDWKATLMLRQTTLSDGISEARKTIEQNTHSLELTRDKLKKANRDLEDAREILARRERAVQ
jgi:hypothetical protein